MIRKTLILIGILSTLSVSYAAQTAHWGYSGHEGPENWAKLSADNSACTGNNQSPINLTGFIEAELAPIEFNYQAGGHEILNNGHTVQINYEEGSHFNLDGIDFELLQYHFHAPSENSINGQSFPLEAHLVHADKDGNLAVVAIMFEVGAENEGLISGWSIMPEKAGDKHPLSQAASAGDLLPEDQAYYRFNGSLTTPPCSEGVRWLLMKQAVTVSAQQVDAFAAVLHEPNNRPTQALNARVILQ